MGRKKEQRITPRPENRRFKDRGDGKFFHGRNDHREFVRSILDDAAVSARDGTAVVFQGPPGVGKTALLGRLEGDAKLAGWRVVHIKPAALESPIAMVQALGKDYAVDWGEESTARGEANVNLPGVVKAGVGGRVSKSRTIAGTRTVSGAMRDILTAGDKVVLVLDEAQHLAEPSSKAGEISIRDTLNDIINGRTGRRVVLLIGGLSHTWDALRKRGASRLEVDCIRNLGRVREKTARRILSDWLDEVGCMAEHKPAWTQALAGLAENYPQHLMLCVKSARAHFARHKSSPTAAAIEAVGKSVERRKQRFYGHRTKGIPSQSVALLGMLVGAWERGIDYTSDVIIEAIAVNTGRDTEAAQECFSTLLAQGVVAEREEGGDYHIPIPSMERHLVAKAIQLAITQPVIARDLWYGVVKVVLSKRGRINIEHQKRIEVYLPPQQGLETEIGEAL